MSLVADVAVPARGVQMAVSVPTGSTTAVIGPNGSGKSTLLGAIAGIVPSMGGVQIDDRMLDEPGRAVPPHRRGVTLLAQHPRLFPRMSALDNVAFPLRSRGTRRREARVEAQRLLDLVQAGDLGARRPAELSGGESQRVALARALAAEPRVLLLDEPMAALDQPVAAAIRQTLGHILAGRTSLLVTHEILDAALLADRIVVVDAGRVVESGPITEVMTRPRTAFAARLCGLNLMAGTAVGPDHVRTSFGEVTGVGHLRDGEQAVATFRPGSVAVYREDPGGSPRNAFRATVVSLEPQGDLVRLRTPHLAADLTPAAVAALTLRPGDEVVLSVKAAEVQLYQGAVDPQIG